MGFQLNIPRTREKLPCERKLKHISKREAEKAIKEMFAAHKLMKNHSKYEISELRKLQAYFCKNCASWHCGRTDDYVQSEEGPR